MKEKRFRLRGPCMMIENLDAQKPESKILAFKETMDIFSKIRPERVASLSFKVNFIREEKKNATSN